MTRRHQNRTEQNRKEHETGPESQTRTAQPEAECQERRTGVCGGERGRGRLSRPRASELSNTRLRGDRTSHDRPTSVRASTAGPCGACMCMCRVPRARMRLSRPGERGAPKYIIWDVNLVHHSGKRLEPSGRVHTTPMHLEGICEAPRRSILRFEGAVNTLFTPPGDSGGRSDRGYRHLQLSCAARRARHCIRTMPRSSPVDPLS